MGQIEPMPIYTGPADWRGPDLADDPGWRIPLDRRQIGQLIEAVERSRDQGIAPEDLSPETFRLPDLEPVLGEAYQRLVNGCGLTLFQGMPVNELDRDGIIRAYLGIGSWLGRPVSQNHKGHLLGHVKDIGLDHNNPQHRVYGTTYRQPYHTDSADLVGLLCLREAKSGGVFTVCSSVAIYNEIARTRPDLARTLCSPFIIDRKGEVPEGKQPTYEMAVFHHYRGRMLCMHDRNFIDAAQRRGGVPPLSDLQIEALDLFDALAADPAFHLDHVWREGDMGFIHNHQALHARTDYEDYPEPERKRHLLRLWLSTNDGAELPPVFAERYGTVSQGAIRGGIQVPGMSLKVPLEAE